MTDLAVSRPFQIFSDLWKHIKSKTSPIIWQKQELIWKIRSISIFPNHPPFLWQSAIIPDIWKQACRNCFDCQGASASQSLTASLWRTLPQMFISIISSYNCWQFYSISKLASGIEYSWHKKNRLNFHKLKQTNQNFDVFKKRKICTRWHWFKYCVVGDYFNY